MRRNDREMSEEFALSVSDNCEYAVISMIGIDLRPYCIPITIVRKDNYIYFHSAKEGYKLDCLNKNPDVCVACVGYTYRTPNKFTTEYESAIINGEVSEVIDSHEKKEALRMLCERHNPTNMPEFESSVTRSIEITSVWRIKIQDITGKRKKYDKNGKEMKYGRME